MTREEILSKAEDCVCRSREEQYGSAEDSFRVIAELWTPYLRAKCISPNADVNICPEDVANLMALLKVARIATGHYKEDSYIDGCGYLACGGELAAKLQDDVL